MEQNCSIATVLSKQNVLKSGSLKKISCCITAQMVPQKNHALLPNSILVFLGPSGFFFEGLPGVLLRYVLGGWVAPNPHGVLHGPVGGMGRTISLWGSTLQPAASPLPTMHSPSFTSQSTQP